MAERSYSIASAPGERVAITVERLDDGEVSPYLTDELCVGDDLELRGPIGGYFVWEPEDGGPLLLLGGPGTVVRCRSCDSVLMVFAKTHDRTCVDLLGLADLG